VGKQRVNRDFDTIMLGTHSERWLEKDGAYEGFQGRADRIRERLLDMVNSVDAIIGYGAPAKATTLLNFCDIDNRTIETVVDTTPAKQNRFIPGVRIPIVAPDSIDLKLADAVLLLSWNYQRTIIRNNPEVQQWIIPIPAPVVL
jgi:hypothetical protein